MNRAFRWMRLLAFAAFVSLPAPLTAGQDLQITDDNPLLLPSVGAHQLRILSSNLLELTLITTKPPDPAPVGSWNFVDSGGQPRLPATQDFRVRADGETLP